MFKALALLAGTVVLFASTSSYAEKVYSESAGAWHLNGYVDYADPSNNSCVFSTRWADGKRIQVNVFPKYNGTSNVTMTVLNPYWNNSAWDIGSQFQTRLDFKSYRYGDRNMTGTATTYTGNKIIFRGLNANFVRQFIKSESVTLFTNSRDELAVNLAGTAALSAMLNDCRATVLSGYVNSPGDNF